jgi:hypothetical protein
MLQSKLQIAINNNTYLGEMNKAFSEWDDIEYNNDDDDDDDDDDVPRIYHPTFVLLLLNPDSSYVEMSKTKSLRIVVFNHVKLNYKTKKRKRITCLYLFITSLYANIAPTWISINK